MSRDPRRSLVAATGLFTVIASLAIGAGAAANEAPVRLEMVWVADMAVTAGAAPGDTTGSGVTETTAPADDGPDGSPPAETAPDDTGPRDTADTTPDDTLVGAGSPDDDIDPLTATLAIVGFVALVGLASWWMVRRDDPDAGPMPPSRPPNDGLI